jgi:proline iminopeptidase
MKNALPNAELVVFPNSSHTPFYEEPDAYYRVLLDFLGRHRTS